MMANCYRSHGEKPFHVLAIHGGPGASGSLYDLCEKIGKETGIVELLNQGESIEAQINEIHKVVNALADQPVILIGHSWGAWLSIYYENAHPQVVKKIILVSSGPFDQDYVNHIEQTRNNRMSRKTKEKLSEHFVKINEMDETIANEHFAKAGQIISSLDSFDVYQEDISEKTNIDMNIYRKVWSEAAQRRKSGQLIEAVKKVKCPITVIHGDHDPHPLEGIKKPLEREGLDVEVFLLSKCGHYPWREKNAKETFYKIIENLINN